MKKLIIIFVLFLYPGIAQAQSEAETLEWLNTKKIEFNIYWCQSNTIIDFHRERKITIGNDNLFLESEAGASTSIPWASIKDIQLEKIYFQHLTVISNKMDEKGNNIFIKIGFRDKDFTPKYLKALKHMATLKGAKLIDDDLFGN